MDRVFLSHSRWNSTAAQALFRWLTDSEPSLRGQIFLDIDPEAKIAPGVRWKAELTRAMDRCEAVICLISPQWENSPECLAEARLAESLNKRVFCARIDPAAQGTGVREWQICDLFPNGDRVTTVAAGNGESVDFCTDGLAQLLRGLRRAGIGAEHFPWPPENDPARAPYRGWQSMENVDAAVFFGRDPQILRGMDTLRGMRATAVEGLFVILGPSGVGKSSFLRAGLLPRLRRDPANFLVSEIVRPEREPLTGDQGLAHAIWHLRSQSDPAGPTLGEVKAACRDAAADRLSRWLRESQLEAADDDGLPTVVVPIDQGEELFSAEAGAEAGAFLALLGALLRTGETDELQLIVAMTIRADRYEALQQAPELLAVRAREFGDLKPPPVTEYKGVITGPADRATAAGLRLSLDPALVARLLDDATGGADSLPLLALTLSRLYLDYGSTGRLALADYESMGGMERIVQAEVDTLLAVDPRVRARQLDTLRSAFIPWLATIDQDTDAPSRRVARWDELPSDSHALIDAMVARRLLVKDERGGALVVEVALESLLRQWDSLAQWLSEYAEDLKAVDNLDRAAAEWELNERSPEWLFEGARLATARQLAGHSLFRDRVRHAAEFLEASRAQEQAQADAERRRTETELRIAQERRDEAEAYTVALRSRAKVLRVVLAVTLVVALVAIVASVVALVARNQADAKRLEAEVRTRDALAGRLTSQVQAMLAGGRPGSDLEVVVKALAARQLSAHEGAGALLSVLTEKPRVAQVFDSLGGLVSDNGQRMVSFTEQGYQLWDTESGTRIGAPLTDRDRKVHALSPDGRFFAMVSDGTQIRVWDTKTTEYIGQPMKGGDEYVGKVAVDAEGRRIAAIDDNGKLLLWDVSTGQQIPIEGHSGEVKALTFSRDGQRLASAGTDNTVRLWDTDNAEPVGTPLHTEDDAALFSVALSPDGRTVAAGGIRAMANNNAPLWIWNAENGAPVGKPAPGTFEAIWSIAFSTQGTTIATGGMDHAVHQWDARTGDPVGEPITLQSSIFGLAFTPRDDRIVAISPDDVQIVSAGPGSGLSTEVTGSRAASGHGLYGLVNTGDGPRIIQFNDGTMRWLNVDTGEQIGAPVVSDVFRSVAKISFSPDRRWLAVASRDAVRVLDPSNGQTVGSSLEIPGGQVNDMTFSPDGKFLATAGEDKAVRLWDWRQGTSTGEPMGGHKYGVQQVEFSPDGDRIYTRDFRSVRVWNAETQQSIDDLPTGASPTAMAIRSDGRRFAVADYNYIQEFDADSTEPVGPQIRGRGHAAADLTYGSDGRYLVSVGTDRTVRFWDVASGTQIGDAVDATATGEGTEIQVSRDERRIFVSTETGSGPTGWSSQVGGGIWELPGPAAWVDELCEKLTTNPTRKMWQEWVSQEHGGTTELCPNKPGPL
ncbi:nSTAND1 domain-containing NTPase [Nocardia sp. NPDC055053]